MIAMAVDAPIALGTFNIIDSMLKRKENGLKSELQNRGKQSPKKKSAQLSVI